MLPLSGTSFPAFVGFHRELTTFGYTKTVEPFSNTVDHSAQANGDTLLGYFSIRSCGDPAVSVVVQLNGRVPFSHVFLNATQAELAGFSEGQEVILDPIHHTICESVEIIPLTANDYQILDSNSVLVEEELLQQISIVRRGTVVPFWISPSLYAKFRIGQIVPDTDMSVILHNSTELHIVPVSNAISPSGIPRGAELKTVPITNVARMLEGLTGSLDLFHPNSLPVDQVFRCLNQDQVQKSTRLAEFLAQNAATIFALNTESNYILLDVVRVVSTLDLNHHKYAILVRIPKTNSLDGMFLTIRDMLQNNPGHCIMASAWKLDYVGIHLSGINAKKYQELSAATVQIKTAEDVPEEAIQGYICSNSSLFPIIFGSPGILHNICFNGSSYDVFLSPGEHETRKSKDRSETCYAITPGTKINVEVVASLPETFEEHSYVNYGFSTSLGKHDFQFQSAVADDFVHHVEYHYDSPEIPTKLLLLGPSGSGKSAVTGRVARLLAYGNKAVFTSFVDCNTWKGKQADNIEKMCRTEMKKLEARIPSLLIFDNLDFFQLQNEDEQRQIGIEKIFHTIRTFIMKSKIPVIATARKRTTLHKSLVAAGGTRLFSHIYEIAPLTQAQRADVLGELIELDCDVSAAAKVTENFTVADLKKLALRVQIEATLGGHKSPSDEYLTKALQLSKPAGHVVQTKTSERKFGLQDVGGMHKQKQLLNEVLLWPAKYSELFNECGIKLGRGVLLHGASGCGKTLLAKAFSDDTKFNVISVKGPELLSKYIGSSEENVRQVFERARASAPCVILFDELDSLAPRRGSDSTGVTDRVVNQLLTELDGAEGLHGVFVIGCTSRLDLIDPALIRPGRFDHLVECSLPDQHDRESIFNVILRDVPHSDDVRAPDLAKITDGWTGADLKALLTNARFEAARRLAKEGKKSSLSVSLVDIEAVFDDSKPKERGERQELFRAGQRVTLA